MSKTTNSTRRRSFSKIQPAEITFGSVRTGTGANGKKYRFARGCTITIDGQEPLEQRTVMLFESALNSVGHLVKKDRKVRLAVRRDQGSFQIVGEIRQAA